jgi:hypothetical protein
MIWTSRDCSCTLFIERGKWENLLIDIVESMMCEIDI